MVELKEDQNMQRLNSRKDLRRTIRQWNIHYNSNRKPRCEGEKIKRMSVARGLLHHVQLTPVHVRDVM